MQKTALTAHSGQDTDAAAKEQEDLILRATLLQKQKDKLKAAKLKRAERADLSVTKNSKNKNAPVVSSIKNAQVSTNPRNASPFANNKTTRTENASPLMHHATTSTEIGTNPIIEMSQKRPGMTVNNCCSTTRQGRAVLYNSSL